MRQANYLLSESIGYLVQAVVPKCATLNLISPSRCVITIVDAIMIHDLSTLCGMRGADEQYIVIIIGLAAYPPAIYGVQRPLSKTKWF